MVRSGTIKTLATLLAAMTFGTALLILMETAPARPLVPVPLQALKNRENQAELELVRNTEVELAYQKWRNIIVHDLSREPGVAKGCHFVIGGPDGKDAVVRATSLWTNQQDGNHITMPGFSYNQTSIGICLAVNTNKAMPTAAQRKALVNLVRTLQAQFEVPADHVYLHSDLGENGCPGGFFSSDEFRSQLISSQ
jgi:N-acetyl-anhydromuramyl-L-alanine amidase AmpD